MSALIGMWALSQTGGFERFHIRLLTAALVLAAVAVALQIVPLSYDLFAKLQPAADALLRAYRRTYPFSHPTQHALSIDPGATLVALGLYVAFALLLLGLTSALPWMPVGWLLSRIMALGFVVAVISVIPRAAPFFNRHHFAGWMVMVLPLALAYAAWILEGVRWPQRRNTAGWIHWCVTPDARRLLLIALCIATMMTAVLISGSQSGIESLAIAAIVFGVGMAHRLATTTLRRIVALGLCALIGAAIFWSATSAPVARFSPDSVDVRDGPAGWRNTRHIIADFPWFGAGLGTYGNAMLAYQTRARAPSVLPAQNAYLRLQAEGGVMVSGAAVIILLVIAIRIVGRFRNGDADPLRYWARAGAVAGLAGIATQSIVEYSLQQPGNLAVLVVLLALAMHRSLSRTGAHANRL